MRINLINARNEKGFTISEMSILLNITERQYRYIEAGTRGTSEENWIKLFEFYDEEIPLNKLMENTPKTQKDRPHCSAERSRELR